MRKYEYRGVSVMFLKMLKSELKHNKGLNAILIVFMTIASVLIFAGSVQVYSYLTCEARTAEKCNSYADFFIIGSRRSRIEERRRVTERVINECECADDFQRLEMVEIASGQIDFAGFEEKDSDSFLNKGYYITTMPEKYDLVFGLNDKPFTVPNGCIAVPVSVKNITGSKIGDRIRITTDTGYIYELVICGFFKDQFDYKMRCILSEDDYKVISSGFNVVHDMYDVGIKHLPDEPNPQAAVYNSIHEGLEQNYIGITYSGIGDLTNEKIMMMIVSVFVLIISIFMILIILMTIRFTIIAALKEEEKEIGVMRAIGVESFAFRWLFSAKYIGFALAGGLAGLTGGFFASKYLIATFSPNMTAPPNSRVILIGTVSVAALSVMMILFTLGVMRRINRISVIDAIHGENRGERFGNSAVLYLFKRRKMPVPFYLAFSDILKRFKRYIFLLVSYVLGISVILITVNLRNTVISEKFMCYSDCYALDFDIRFDDSDELARIRNRGAASGRSLWEQINEDLKKAGIPAEIDIVKRCTGYLTLGEGSISYPVYVDGYHPERYTYRKGGCAPELENEIAMSYFTAKKKGLKVGDTVELSMPVLSDDKMSEEYVSKQFIITGFIDAIEANGGCQFIFAGGNNASLYKTRNTTLSRKIFAPDHEKKNVLRQIEGLYNSVTVFDGEEYARRYLSEYDRIFALLEYVMSGTVVFITLLMTYLYMNIFIAEETREMALLKSMGFTDADLWAWQLVRILSLTAAAAVIAVIFVKTAGTLVIRRLFEMLELTGFSFLPEYLFSFVLIPLGCMITVCIASVIKLRETGSINISRINEE